MILREYEFQMACIGDVPKTTLSGILDDTKSHTGKKCGSDNKEYLIQNQIFYKICRNRGGILGFTRSRLFFVPNLPLLRGVAFQISC